MDEELVDNLKTGCTVWNKIIAIKLRELETTHPDWIKIIEIDELESITGTVFDGTKTLPYFGAILTKKGTKNIDQIAAM